MSLRRGWAVSFKSKEYRVKSGVFVKIQGFDR